MGQEEYVLTVLEIIGFHSADVITTSNSIPYEENELSFVPNT